MNNIKKLDNLVHEQIERYRKGTVNKIPSLYLHGDTWVVKVSNNRSAQLDMNPEYHAYDRDNLVQAIKTCNARITAACNEIKPKTRDRGITNTKMEIQRLLDVAKKHKIGVSNVLSLYLMRGHSVADVDYILTVTGRK